MIFLGYTPRMKGFKFMRKPNNICSHIGANYPGTEFNIPPKDGDVDGGDAFFPNVPPAGGGPHYYGPPGGPSGPQGPQGSSGFLPVPPQPQHRPPTPKPEPPVTPLDQGTNPWNLDQKQLYSNAKKGKGQAQDPGPYCPETPSQQPHVPMHPHFLPGCPGPQWDTSLSQPLESKDEPSWTLDNPIPGDMYQEWCQNRDKRRALWNRMGEQSSTHTQAQPQTPPQQEPPRRSGRVRQQ